MILTLPTTKSGRAVVRRREGVIVNRIPYWCGLFRNHSYNGKKFPIRYDPYDFSVIYILIDGEWVEARCRRFQRAFLGLTEPEIRVATTELQGAATTLVEKRRAITASALATFFFARGLTPSIRRVQARATANKFRAHAPHRGCKSEPPRVKRNRTLHTNDAPLAASPIPDVALKSLPKHKRTDRAVGFVRWPNK